MAKSIPDDDKPDVPELVIPATEAAIVGLTERERRYATAFFEASLDAGTDIGISRLAYRRAFPDAAPSDKSLTTLSRALIQNPRVRAHVAYLRQEYSKRLAVPVERVQQELERIAYANILDFMTIDQVTGEARIDLRGMSHQTASAIAEITIDEDIRDITDKETGDVIAREGSRKIKFKLHSKMDALDKLARIHGVYQDKMSVTFTLNELDQAIALIEQKIRQQAAPEMKQLN